MTKCLTQVVSYPLMVVLVLSAYAASPITPSNQSDEEYAVYAAVVDELFVGNRVSFDTREPVNLLVVKNHTAVDSFGDRIQAENLSGDFGDHIRHWLSTLPPEAVEDYRIKNRESRRLTGDLSLKIKHVLVEKDELEQYCKAGRWEEFYKRYPESGGFISFSRVGFNREMNEAFVYFEHWCHGVCGSGFYLVLRKGKEGWKIVKLDRAWIS